MARKAQWMTLAVALLSLVSFSFSSSRIGGECVVSNNCSQGLSCLDGICGCKSNQVYNPNYRPAKQDCTVVYSKIQGACQSPAGTSCKIYSDCLTDSCDISEHMCTCSSSIPTANGTQCHCYDASFWSSEFNRCQPYTNSQYDTTTRRNVCPADHTIQNDTTRSCDCLMVKGDPSSGIFKDTHFDWRKELCVCDEPLEFSSKNMTNCICTGAAAIDNVTGKCKGYKGATYGFPRYSCPLGMAQHDDTRSCDCTVAGTSYSTTYRYCVWPNGDPYWRSP